MTVLDDRQLLDWHENGPVRHPRPVGAPPRQRSRSRRYGPAPTRPRVTPLPYQRSRVTMSRAPHTRRPVSTAVTVALAGIAALITLWLGSLAHLSADRAPASAPTADRLAVVQVQPGETLQQLAARVAPDSERNEVVDRLRDLNDLETAALDAGQTLIAPLG